MTYMDAYISNWIVRPVWKPTESEAKVVHQIMGECIAKGFGVRMIAEYFSVRVYYVYDNVPVKWIYRKKRLEESTKNLLIEQREKHLAKF